MERTKDQRDGGLYMIALKSCLAHIEVSLGVSLDFLGRLHLARNYLERSVNMEEDILYY